MAQLHNNYSVRLSGGKTASSQGQGQAGGGGGGGGGLEEVKRDVSTDSIVLP